MSDSTCLVSLYNRSRSMPPYLTPPPLVASLNYDIIIILLSITLSPSATSVSLEVQGCKSFRFSLISDFFIKSSFKGARANYILII